VTDPLASLLELAGVPEALAAAREAVDKALRNVPRDGAALPTEVGLRTAVASAALDGHRYPLEEVRAGTVTDPVLQGALRVSQELGRMAALWPKVPRQVLARVHVLVSVGTVDAAEVGRPRPEPAAVGRLFGVLDLVARARSTGTPALLVAAVVHGELLTLRPFAGPAGLVARAAARLTLVSTGLDPDGLLPIDCGHLAREPEYTGAAGAFATGTPDGLRAWLRHYASAVTHAAGELSAIPDQLG
jgi:hypothetical protein